MYSSVLRNSETLLYHVAFIFINILLSASTVKYLRFKLLHYTSAHSVQLSTYFFTLKE